MKSELKTVEIEQVIDWGKAQLVMSYTGEIVMIDKNNEERRSVFSGSVVRDSHKISRIGHHVDNWVKSNFSLLPLDQQVVLQNT